MYSTIENPVKMVVANKLDLVSPSALKLVQASWTYQARNVMFQAAQENSDCKLLMWDMGRCVRQQGLCELWLSCPRQICLGFKHM